MLMVLFFTQIDCVDVLSDGFKELVRFLREGKRLEVPAFAPYLVADLMTRCWEKEPGDRPTFSHLENELGNMLEENVRHLYLKMNDDYSSRIHNNANQESNQRQVLIEGEDESHTLFNQLGT